MLVYSFRRSEGGFSPLWKGVRGAVKLVWHPLLFDIFQAIDVPARVMPSCESGAMSPASQKKKGRDCQSASYFVLRRYWRLLDPFVQCVMVSAPQASATRKRTNTSDRVDKDALINPIVYGITTGVHAWRQSFPTPGGIPTEWSVLTPSCTFY